MLKCPYPRIFDFSWFYSYIGLENKARTIGSSVAPSGLPGRQKDVFYFGFFYLKKYLLEKLQTLVMHIELKYL